MNIFIVFSIFLDLFLCFLLSSSDKTVKVWDAGSRQCVQTFYQHSDQV